MPRERRPSPRTITPLSVPAVSGIGMLRFPLKQDALTRARARGARRGRRVQRPDDDRDGRLRPPRRAARSSRAQTASCAACRWRSRRSGCSTEGRRSASITRTARACSAGEPVLFVTGHARGLLSAERVALNYMQRLSGIATLTRALRGRGEGHATRRSSTRARRRRAGARSRSTPCAPAAARTTAWISRAGVLIKDNHLAASTATSRRR